MFGNPHTVSGPSQPLDKAGSDVQLQPGKVRLALRQGAPQTFTVRYRQADDYPVDLYYLMDLTHSMKDHRDKVAELADDMGKDVQKAISFA
ncbi:integrin beta subunit, putative [Ixodes scapularis]|uniref:Integrin beta n=1 Tax=Ixodes scapularis TaxID=6945 RepID=B7Q3D7_IXOSC|nr:integrin beta subunit, putative [Ixodes scapularis]|eukprot:XP_002411235.1 integrin beta subunit, putative [Ixodes scapularis]